MRSVLRTSLSALLLALGLASGVGALSSLSPAAAAPVVDVTDSPTADPQPTAASPQPTLCVPPLCASAQPTVEPTTAAPEPTKTATSTPTPSRTPSHTRSPRPQHSSDPNVQLPTGVPFPTDSATETPEPSPSAAAASSDGKSDPLLRAIQAAVAVAILLALLGGLGLYLTREHR